MTRANELRIIEQKKLIIYNTERDPHMQREIKHEKMN